MIMQQNIVLVSPRHIFFLLDSSCFVGHMLPVYVTYIVSKGGNTVQLTLSYQSQILL